MFDLHGWLLYAYFVPINVWIRLSNNNNNASSDRNKHYYRGFNKRNV